jgi:hypothetical protein
MIWTRRLLVWLSSAALWGGCLLPVATPPLKLQVGPELSTVQGGSRNRRNGELHVSGSFTPLSVMRDKTERAVVFGIGYRYDSPRDGAPHGPELTMDVLVTRPKTRDHRGLRLWAHSAAAILFDTWTESTGGGLTFGLELESSSLRGGGFHEPMQVDNGTVYNGPAAVQATKGPSPALLPRKPALSGGVGVLHGEASWGAYVQATDVLGGPLSGWSVTAGLVLRLPAALALPYGLP